MKQTPNYYKTYRILLCIFNIPLTLIIFCFISFIVTIPIALLTNSNFDKAVEPIGWIVFGALLGLPFLIIPSAIVGLIISSQVEKLKLCRNKKDIRQSLIITIQLYGWITILVSIMLIISVWGNLPAVDALKNTFLILIYGSVLVFSASLTSLIFSCFLPTKIFNINENLSGSLKNKKTPLCNTKNYLI